MWIIVKKELADYFGSFRYLIILTFIAMVSLVSSNMLGVVLKEALSQSANSAFLGRSFLLLYTTGTTFFSIVSFLAFFGPLIGIVLGFDAINKERSQGTLSKVISQPVYRYEFILAKFLAGFFTIFISITSILILVAALAFINVGVVPSADEVWRLIIFWLLSLIYVGFWLGLSIFISIICSSVSTAALIGSAIWLFFAFFITVLASLMANSFLPKIHEKSSLEDIVKYEAFYNAVNLLSPVNLYIEAGNIILDPTKRSLAPNTKRLYLKDLDKNLMEHFKNPLPVKQSAILFLPYFTVILNLCLLIFWFSFLVFLKQEIRSG